MKLKIFLKKIFFDSYRLETFSIVSCSIRDTSPRDFSIMTSGTNVILAFKSVYHVFKSKNLHVNGENVDHHGVRVGRILYLWGGALKVSEKAGSLLTCNLFF